MFTHRLKCNEKIIYPYVYVFLREVNNEEGNDVLNHNTQSDSKITHSFGKESSQNRRSRSIVVGNHRIRNLLCLWKYTNLSKVPRTRSKHRVQTSTVFFSSLLHPRSIVRLESELVRKEEFSSFKEKKRPSIASIGTSNQAKPANASRGNDFRNDPGLRLRGSALFPEILSMFGPARQKKAAERQRRPHIAGSDWLIGKPNSSKLIGIINSTRAAERAREGQRGRGG